jgi:hypothetical protein
LASELPANVPIRTGDAIHLAEALEAGESEIWTTDHHLLAAALCRPGGAADLVSAQSIFSVAALMFSVAPASDFPRKFRLVKD